MVLVADFQQLQLVVSGGLCKLLCDRMQSCPLDTAYRSHGKSHILLCNRIGEVQPDRVILEQSFEERLWHSLYISLRVYMGMRLADKYQQALSWPITINVGASEVCKAALACVGVTDQELASGYYCDPSSDVRSRNRLQEGHSALPLSQLRQGPRFVN